MAHFARVVEGIVEEVMVVVNEVITDENGVEQEQLGKDFLSELFGHDSSQIVQCSYNGSFRGNYPSAGWLYFEDLDIFMPPKLYESWVLNEDTCLWEAPVAYPEDGKTYTWNEGTGAWVEMEDEVTE
jgi:hypothetical protein